MLIASGCKWAWVDTARNGSWRRCRFGSGGLGSSRPRKPPAVRVLSTLRTNRHRRCRRPETIRRLDCIEIWQIFWPNFGGLVLGFLEADFCEYLFISQHFSSATRFAHFCTTQNAKKNGIILKISISGEMSANIASGTCHG